MAAYAIGVNNQPYMKPAVGPKKIAIPPRPPVNTGKPNAANANNIPIVIVAGRVGNNIATNITPMFCKTIGTPRKPTVIGGAKAKPIKTANNSPIRVKVFVCMKSPFPSYVSLRIPYRDAMQYQKSFRACLFCVLLPKNRLFVAKIPDCYFSSVNLPS